MYETILMQKDDKIKFQKDKVAIQDKMLFQMKDKETHQNVMSHVSKSDCKINTDLKKIPNKELNKVMGIRSPDLGGSKK